KPGDLVEEVPGHRASPVEDRLEASGVVRNEDVAVEEIRVDQVANRGARREKRAQRSFSRHEDLFDTGRRLQPCSPAAHSSTRTVLKRRDEPLPPARWGAAALARPI